MKRENLNILMSGAALALSLISLALWFCKYDPVTWTLIDSVMTIVSVLVAVFVASQIYHSFTLREYINEDNKRLLEKIDSKIADAEIRSSELLNKRLKEYDCEVTSNVYLVYSFTLLDNHQYERALDYVMRAIEALNDTTDKTSMGGIISVLEYIQKSEIRIILEGTKDRDRYIGILSKSGNADLTRFIPYICSLC